MCDEITSLLENDESAKGTLKRKSLATRRGTQNESKTAVNKEKIRQYEQRRGSLAVCHTRRPLRELVVSVVQ